MKRDLRCLPKLKTLFPFSLHSVSLEWASLVSCKVPGVEFSSTTLLSRSGFVQRAAAGPSRQPGPSASSASCGLVTLSPFLHLCISGFSSLRGDFPGRMGGGEGGRGLSGVTCVKPREGNLSPEAARCSLPPLVSPPRRERRLPNGRSRWPPWAFHSPPASNFSGAAPGRQVGDAYSSVGKGRFVQSFSCL